MDKTLTILSLDKAISKLYFQKFLESIQVELLVCNTHFPTTIQVYHYTRFGDHLCLPTLEKSQLSDYSEHNKWHRQETVPLQKQPTRTQSMLQQKYPSDEWIRVFTDGSATEETEDGGGGIYIEWPDGSSYEYQASIPTGMHSSNYKAEAEALLEGANILSQDKATYDCKVVFLTDAKSVL